MEKVTEQIRALPRGEAEFGREIKLLQTVAGVMHETTAILARPETGPPAIGAETEVIELLLQSRRINPARRRRRRFHARGRRRRDHGRFRDRALGNRRQRKGGPRSWHRNSGGRRFGAVAPGGVPRRLGPRTPIGSNAGIRIKGCPRTAPDLLRSVSARFSDRLEDTGDHNMNMSRQWPRWIVLLCLGLMPAGRWDFLCRTTAPAGYQPCVPAYSQRPDPPHPQPAKGRRSSLIQALSNALGVSTSQTFATATLDVSTMRTFATWNRSSFPQFQQLLYVELALLRRVGHNGSETVC